MGLFMAFDFTVPVYITAKSADDLLTVMAKNNMKYGMNFRYFDIQFVENKWFAWYYLDKTKVMKDKINTLIGGENKRLLDG